MVSIHDFDTVKEFGNIRANLSILVVSTITFVIFNISIVAVVEDAHPYLFRLKFLHPYKHVSIPALKYAILLDAGDLIWDTAFPFHLAWVTNPCIC